MKYQTISLTYFFAVKGTIYHLVIIAVMIYHADNYHVFGQSSPGISLVFILVNEGCFVSPEHCDLCKMDNFITRGSCL